MIVCTSICANYLPKAMVLAKSLKTHNPEAIMVVCLLEKSVPLEIQDFKYFDYVVLAKDLGFADFNKHIFKHSIVEAATSIKGQLFLYLLASFPKEMEFVYLDPDIKVMDSLAELEAILQSNQIVLTPHIFQPEETLDNVVHNEINSLKYGIFNLGFLAIRRGMESQRFIAWWAKRLEMFCYNDIPNGIFTDQKWIDLVPVFFETYILKHPGYNLAPWNYSTRKIMLQGSKYYVNDKPLKFIHFSGFDSGANMLVTRKYILDETNSIYKLVKEYIEDQQQMRAEELSHIPWSYDYFASGEKIKQEARVIYRNNDALQLLSSDPYGESNEAFLGILQEIEDDEWENLSNKLHDSINEKLLENMKFQLCYIKKRYKNTSVNYVIWGASKSGEITRKIVETILPNFKLRNYVDSYKTDSIEGHAVCTSDDIIINPAEVVIIATSTGKKEVEDFLQNHGYRMWVNYIFGYGVS